MKLQGFAVVLLLSASTNGGALTHDSEHPLRLEPWSHLKPATKTLGRATDVLRMSDAGSAIHSDVLPMSDAVRSGSLVLLPPDEVGSSHLYRCERTGVFPISGSCRDFYLCGPGLKPENYYIYKFSCPIGTTFEISTHSCAYAPAVASRPECMIEGTSAAHHTDKSISSMNPKMLVETRVRDIQAHKRSKRSAVIATLTAMIAVGSLLSAANSLFKTGKSDSSGVSGRDLQRLEDKLVGIEGKINGVGLSVLENRIVARIDSSITQSLITKSINDNQMNFEATQSLINLGFLENRMRTAEIQGLIIQGNIDNESNFARLQVSISELKQFINDEIVEAKSILKRGFDSVSAAMERSRIEPLVSKLLTLIKGFRERLNHLQSLPEMNRKDEIERTGGYLEYLESSTLQDTLRDVIQQNFAIPSTASDLTAVFMLEFLVHCLQVHASMLSSVISSNVYLASQALEAKNLEEFNTYMVRVHSAVTRVKVTLGSSDQQGLIAEVKEVLRKVQHLPYFSDIQGINQILLQNIADVSQLESDVEKLISDNTELTVPGTIVSKPDFATSSISVPIGPWENGKQVSYAVQLLSEKSLSQVGPWSTSYTIQDKANPTIKLSRVEPGTMRLLYRRFNQETPELVAIVKDNDHTLLRDIVRDILNAAARPNEDLAIKEIETLIDVSSDINVSLEKKMTPLHYAAKHGNVKVMNILITKGADVHAKATDEQVALHFAALFGSREGVEYLISKGAQTNAQTRLLGLSSLHLAVANSHVEATRALLENGAFINIKDNNGLTPLHISVAGNGDTIDVLLENENLDINAVEENGLTPLHYAARSSNEIFTEKLLLDENINVNARSDSQLRPIDLAAMGGNVNIISELYKSGAEIDFVDAYGSTPLHYAAFYGNVKAVLMLMELGPSLENMKNTEGKTALDYAADNDREEVIRLLGGDTETRITIMDEQFGEQSTIPESDPTVARSRSEQGAAHNNCSGEMADDMAIGSEETCAHIGHVESYVNLVMSMIPLARYYSDHLEFSKIFQNYDDDLSTAQDHARIWRNGNSIVKGIGSTFELARKFEIEFSRKYQINQKRVKRIKAKVDEEKEIMLLREEISNLEELIRNATIAQKEVQVRSIQKFFKVMISGYNDDLQENKRKLEEDFTLIHELDELAAFMEFVRSDSSKIQAVALETQGKVEVFRDHLEQDKGAFLRHHQVADHNLNLLEKEAIKNDQMVAEYKRQEEELKLKIEEERQQIKERFDKINESHRHLRDMRRDLMKKVGNNNVLKIMGIILTPVIIGIPMLIVANNNEKASIALLNDAVRGNKAEVENIATQIQHKQNEIGTLRELIANNSKNSETLKNELNDFIFLDKDLENLSHSTETLLKAINKAIAGVKVIKEVFDGVTKKLGEMIDLATNAKTEAERLNARFFIYTELSLLECNWRDVYINVMNLNDCTKNFEVLY